MIPTYDRFIEPILRFLAAHPQGAPAREAHDAAAFALKLDSATRLERLPSGVQPIYKNRAGWAHDRLKRAGLSESPRRGFWVLTEKGHALVKRYPGPLPDEVLEDLATGHDDVVLRGSSSSNGALPNSTPGPLPATSPAPVEATQSPDDRLETALAEIRDAVASELLDVLGKVHPTQFETIVLDLLHALGYGTSRSDLQRVGGTGDGGIDGVISLDRLGLEKVYVQAKRWQNTVSRPEIQGFYGALAGQRANKGVFITTSNFTAQAIEFARSVERIVLVDGARLAQLMIEHGVGVQHRPVKIPKLDHDYFEDE